MLYLRHPLCGDICEVSRPLDSHSCVISCVFCLWVTSSFFSIACSGDFFCVLRISFGIPVLVLGHCFPPILTVFVTCAIFLLPHVIRAAHICPCVRSFFPSALFLFLLVSLYLPSGDWIRTSVYFYEPLVQRPPFLPPHPPTPTHPKFHHCILDVSLFAPFYVSGVLFRGALRIVFLSDFLLWLRPMASMIVILVVASFSGWCLDMLSGCVIASGVLGLCVVLLGFPPCQFRAPLFIALPMQVPVIFRCFRLGIFRLSPGVRSFRSVSKLLLLRPSRW